MSLLAIDIGNTRLKWALFDGSTPGLAPRASGAVFLETIDVLAETDWRSLPAPAAMLGSNVAGDAVRRRVEEQLELWDIEPRWIVPSAQAAGIVNGYDYPSRLGADRWAALAGARWHVLERARLERSSPQPALVVMVGTAVTVDSLDASGRFLGGQQALHHRGQAAGADVLGALVDLVGDLRQRRMPSGSEVERHAFGGQQRLVLLDWAGRRRCW
jgi:type III pantothenate kinase